MRGAIYWVYVCVALTLASSLENELNSLHIASKGYPLFPYYTSGYATSLPTEDGYNQTLATYGLDRIPSQSSSSYYLANGGTLMSSFDLFNNLFIYTTLGFSSFIQNNFPSMPTTLKIMISTAITLNNLIAAVAFIRGLAGFKWL